MAEAHHYGFRGDVRAIVGICPPGRPRIFTLQEARAIFPLVSAITSASAAELEPISTRLREMFHRQDELNILEREYERIVRRWVGKMERLGLVVKGLWLVDFDTGDGYLCWKHPEPEIAHYHTYDKGFTGRRPLAEVIATESPAWA